MRLNKIIGVASGAFGVCANYIWGGIDSMFIALISFMTLDILTGLICGYKSCCLDSKIMYLGITRKKMMILIMVAVAVVVDKLLGVDGVTRSLVIFYYISMEGLSLLETAGKLNFPIPSGLKKALTQINKDNKDEE